jgi:hypothetical protein
VLGEVDLLAAKGREAEVGDLVVARDQDRGVWWHLLLLQVTRRSGEGNGGG